MRILVTRPEPGASRTSTRLAAAGHTPVVLPLTRIEPLAVVFDGQPDAVVVTSANAVAHAPAGLLARLAHLPAFAVGGTTAASLRQAGFRHVRASATDARALMELVATTLTTDTEIAYLCGRVRKPLLESGLTARGYRLTAAETYDTIDTEPDDEEIDAALAGQGVDAVLIYSAKAADAVVRVMRRRPRYFAKSSVICLSADIGDLMRSVVPRVAAAASPDEDAMFALIKELAERPSGSGV